MRSKLPNSVLRRVWNLSDIDQDGMFDRDEFAVAMFLIDHKLSGNDLPDVLPDRLVPPTKVHLQRFNLGAREDERRGRYGEKEDYSGGNSMTSHDASYTKESGYERDTGYRGGSAYRGGGGARGYEDEDTSYSGRPSLLRGEYDYDNDSNLSSFIDRGQ